MRGRDRPEAQTRNIGRSLERANSAAILRPSYNPDRTVVRSPLQRIACVVAQLFGLIPGV